MRKRDLDRLRKLAPQLEWALVRPSKRTIFPLFEAVYRGWHYQIIRMHYDDFMDRKTRDRNVVEAAVKFFIDTPGFEELRQCSEVGHAA